MFSLVRVPYNQVASSMLLLCFPHITFCNYILNPELKKMTALAVGSLYDRWGFEMVEEENREQRVICVYTMNTVGKMQKLCKSARHFLTSSSRATFIDISCYTPAEAIRLNMLTPPYKHLPSTLKIVRVGSDGDATYRKTRLTLFRSIS